MSVNIQISIAQQKLLLSTPTQHKEYDVSTALNGPGQTNGSGCTPLGRHVVRAKIGQNLPLNAVFVGRRFTNEIYTPDLANDFPDRDWILTRILWLSGCERGFNRLGNVDSMRRYIYIHGTPDTEPMGVAKSHGCIRMRNRDIAEVFELTSAGSSVDIQE